MAKTIARPPLPGGNGGGGGGDDAERHRRERYAHWQRIASLNALYNHDTYFDAQKLKRFYDHFQRTFIPRVKKGPPPFFDMDIITRRTPTSRTPFYYLVIRREVPLYDAAIHKEKMNKILSQLLDMNALWIVESALGRMQKQNENLLFEKEIWILLGVSDQEK